MTSFLASAIDAYGAEYWMNPIDVKKIRAMSNTHGINATTIRTAVNIFRFLLSMAF
jgi:hypothetical protein